MARDINGDQVAINHRAALGYAYNVGVLNELNAQEIYDRMVKELRQPAQGYFYADDVDNLCAKLVAELVEA